MGERTKTYNSRLATELGKWAESKGRGDAFHSAVFRAYYVDGVNIAKPDTLIGLAEAVGLPGREAAEVLKTRTFREAVDADWELAGTTGDIGRSDLRPRRLGRGRGSALRSPGKISPRPRGETESVRMVPAGG